MNNVTVRLFALLTTTSAALALVACASGGASAPTLGIPAKTSASLTIVVPRSSSAAQYISPSTQSVEVALYDPAHTTLVTSIAQNVTTGSPGCTAASGSSPLTCTIVLPIAPGAYALDITMYDGTVSAGAATGNTLSASTNVPLTVTAGQANALSVTFAGIPVSAVVIPAASSSLVGTSASGFTLASCAPQTVDVYGVDADGNEILGTGAPTVSLTTSDLNYRITAAGSSAPNTFTIDCLAVDGIPATLEASAVPASGSGTHASLTTVSLTARRTIAGTLAQHAIPVPIGTPQAIAPGPDGALWMTGLATANIARVTTSGTFTTYTSPVVSGPQSIVAGSDGALWFTDNADNKIGRITTSGTITEYATPTAWSAPYGIAAGSDGALWFTEQATNKIGRITTSGSFTEYAVPTGAAAPENITAGPDGALWFTEPGANKIGRITTAGAITEYAVPTTNSSPNDITAGSDGALWFTEESAAKIGRITTSGTIHEYSVSAAAVQPYTIAPGPDGALYFSEYTGQAIGRITTSGTITTFALPGGSAPNGITAGPDGRIWYVDQTPVDYGTIQ